MEMIILALPPKTVVRIKCYSTHSTLLTEMRTWHLVNNTLCVTYFLQLFLSQNFRFDAPSVRNVLLSDVHMACSFDFKYHTSEKPSDHLFHSLFAALFY